MNIYVYYINLKDISLADASSPSILHYVNCCLIDFYLHFTNIPFKNEML